MDEDVDMEVGKDVDEVNEEEEEEVGREGRMWVVRWEKKVREREESQRVETASGGRWRFCCGWGRD